KRARERFDRKPLGGGNAVEKRQGGPGLAVSERSQQSLECGDGQLVRFEHVDGLKRALQDKRSPDARGEAVIPADDMGPDVRRHATLTPPDAPGSGRVHYGGSRFYQSLTHGRPWAWPRSRKPA